MKKNSEREQDLLDFRKSLENIDDKEFDGHTHFQELSAREKLIWLSQLNYFKYISKKSNTSKTYKVQRTNLKDID